MNRLFFYIIGDPPVRLWGISPRERLCRQIRQVSDACPIEDLDALSDDDTVLMVQSGYVTEVRAFQRLLTRVDAVLRCPSDGRYAAAYVSAANAPAANALLRDEPAHAPDTLQTLEPSDLDVFDKKLRRSAPPMLEPISEQNRDGLESELYGNAYKGITDLVTKFFWPRPARHVVRWCAAAGATPNMITGVGFVLMMLAGLLFWQGHYALGLLAGWIMTFLDTVDGKLARVTVQSSRIGHLLDHGMDLLHPPVWYILWGMGLGQFEPPLGLDLSTLNWLIVIGYVGGRVCEALFHQLGSCSIFGWKPFDAYFRLVTARRNPCLILLTLALVLGRPDWGFIAVALWTVLTTLILFLRLLQGTVARAKSGPLEPWLGDSDQAARAYPRAYQMFSVTRGAYGTG